MPDHTITIARRAAEVEAGDLLRLDSRAPYVTRVDEWKLEVCTFARNGLREGEAGVRLVGDHVYPDGSPFGDVRGWQTLCSHEHVFDAVVSA